MNCVVLGCPTEATRRLTAALEVRDGSLKVEVITCRLHGDQLDENAGYRYLVTDSHPL